MTFRFQPEIYDMVLRCLRSPTFLSERPAPQPHTPVSLHNAWMVMQRASGVPASSSVLSFRQEKLPVVRGLATELGALVARWQRLSGDFRKNLPPWSLHAYQSSWRQTCLKCWAPTTWGSHNPFTQLLTAYGLTGAAEVWPTRGRTTVIVVRLPGTDSSSVAVRRTSANGAAETFSSWSSAAAAAGMHHQTLQHRLATKRPLYLATGPEGESQRWEVCLFPTPDWLPEDFPFFSHIMA